MPAVKTDAAKTAKTNVDSAAAAPAAVAPRSRVIIEGVAPEIDGGRFACKRVVGETVMVEADVFADGHDQISGVLRHRRLGERRRHEAPLRPLGNDRWRAGFAVHEQGQYEYDIVAWIDDFLTWRNGLKKKADAGAEISIDLLIGAELMEGTLERLAGADREEMLQFIGLLRDERQPLGARVAAGLDTRARELMWLHDERSHAAELGRELRVVVDRPRAGFSAWYELFPRSASPDPKRHGTFADVEARLPYIAQMGFDVLYLPPIHPIGREFRKGPNNAVKAKKGDVGSPWAIGSPEGGHKAMHPELGSMRDFEALAAAAQQHGMEIALDIAFQCAPDHPYVKEHPEWFRHRPDGTIRYAENPPKKYQDIYPFDFECADWRSLWEELKSVVEFWAEHGVRIFRVDNPHTKPLPFWEWLIAAVKKDRPDVLFLSEAFTRPRVMERLAKLGFTQSYTYFAWRNRPWEIRQYFEELTQTELVDYFRPNAWPNTPDILTAALQEGGRTASVIRFLLASTLCANYGIYGPVFELAEVTPREVGSEEYLDSEKYQRRVWDLEAAHSLRELIARVNQIRREQPALQQDRTLRFHDIDNDNMLCYSKRSPDQRDVILCVVNCDWRQQHWGNTSLDMPALGLEWNAGFEVRDLITGGRYHWQGRHNAVGLDPAGLPAHILHIRSGERSERDFDPHE